MSKVYQIVTDQILEALEQGTAPWARPWAGGGLPLRSCGKAYRGCNTFLLSLVSASQGYTSRYWLSYKQIKKDGGSLKPKQRYTTIIYWNWIDDKKNPGKKIPLLRFYKGYNADQCIDLPAKYQPDPSDSVPIDPIKVCDDLTKGYDKAPKVEHGGDVACYSPRHDRISMPNRDDFKTSEGYYTTLFHEMGHSTGHKDRLARSGVVNAIKFGSHAYGLEELVAEMTAAMLCGVAGIEQSTIENSASYLQNWISAIKGDPKMVVQAAAQAQKAADMIQGIKWDK